MNLNSMHPHANCTCGITRRQFLAGAGASAATALAAPAVLAQAPERTKLIDVHHHIVPPFWFEEVKERIAAQGGGRIIPTWYGWSRQKAIEDMDKNNVATALISMTTPGIWFGDVAQGRRLARASTIMPSRSSATTLPASARFGLFATLPLPDTEGSLKEQGQGCRTDSSTSSRGCITRSPMRRTSRRCPP
jgi:hypothetical protein